MNPLFGCIEAGGTKFVCGLMNSHSDKRAIATIATTSPDETIRQVCSFFDNAQSEYGDIAAFGIASFGPLQLERTESKWGALLDTPKSGWSGVNVMAQLASRFGRPCVVDTDVGAAALAESVYGCARGLRSAAYVTVGTGIGAGLVIDGATVIGIGHPEAGHIRPPRHADDFDFPGICPFHGDCLEGLASGPAILQRWGQPLNQLPHDHSAHELIAWYLGVLAVTLTAVASPHRILFGGGVMQTPGLIERVRIHAAQLGGPYLFGSQSLDELICPPELGTRAGLAGAFVLAQRAHSGPA
jgi:fructokinase